MTSCENALYENLRRNGNKQVDFKFVSQMKDGANAHNMQYVSKPLCSTDIMSIAQPLSYAVKLFCFFSFPLQMLSGRNNVSFYMQFT